MSVDKTEIDNKAKYAKHSPNIPNYITTSQQIYEK